MRCLDPAIFFAAQSIFTAAGFVVAWLVVEAAIRRSTRRLLWLSVGVLICAGLESGFQNGSAGNTSAWLRRLVVDALGWSAVSLGCIALRQGIRPRQLRPNPTRDNPTGGETQTEWPAVANIELSLREEVTRFLAAADRGDVETIAATYFDEFACVRVADDGGFAHFTREQMLAFFRKAAGSGHVIPTRNTKIHHAEILNEQAYMLLTRTKDLGSGWETMFYTLVWHKTTGNWRLIREFVHQKTSGRRVPVMDSERST